MKAVQCEIVLCGHVAMPSDEINIHMEGTEVNTAVLLLLMTNYTHIFPQFEMEFVSNLSLAA